MQKVGDRRYWEQWAKDVATIAERQIERIRYLIAEKQDQRAAFDNFLKGLQQNINPSINEDQAVEMLSAGEDLRGLAEGHWFAFLRDMHALSPPMR